MVLEIKNDIVSPLPPVSPSSTKTSSETHSAATGVVVGTNKEDPISLDEKINNVIPNDIPKSTKMDLAKNLKDKLSSLRSSIVKRAEILKSFDNKSTTEVPASGALDITAMQVKNRVDLMLQRIEDEISEVDDLIGDNMKVLDIGNTHIYIYI